MTSRQRLLKRATELGVAITHDGRRVEYFCPKGFVTAAVGVHYGGLVVQGWKTADLYEALLEDLDMGLKPCETPDCECCAEPNQVPEDVSQFIIGGVNSEKNQKCLDSDE